MTRQLIVARLPQRLDAPCHARWTHECMLLARRCVQFAVAVCCLLYVAQVPCALDALCNPLPTLSRHAHARTHARTHAHTSNRTYARARTHTCACVHARAHAHAHTNSHTRTRTLVRNLPLRPRAELRPTDHAALATARAVPPANGLLVP
jgi:hypothetical protein